MIYHLPCIVFTKPIIYQAIGEMLNKSKNRNTPPNSGKVEFLQNRKNKSKTPSAMPDCISP